MALFQEGAGAFNAVSPQTTKDRAVAPWYRADGGCTDVPV